MSTEIAQEQTPPPDTKKKRPLGRNYRKVYIASVITNLGDGVSAIGYPWLASAITRNPLLIALVGIVQRLPWLLFTLPAGVITDRVDRRRAMIAMDIFRGFITALVAIAVIGLGSDLPSPDDVESVVGTNTALFLVLIVAALMLGMAEVLRDNSAQTIIPSIVVTEDLERANGQMWSAEQIANTFIGPPLGSLLIAVAFFLPFAVDSVSFFFAAALVFLVAGQFRAKRAPDAADTPSHWKTELKEGVRWLWRHDVLRTLAIVLGLLNLINALEFATLVLFAQEVLHTSPVQFALLSMGGAVGGVIGGYAASKVSRKLGTGPSLWLTLFAMIVMPIPIVFTSSWIIVFVMFAIEMFFILIWNVITVSLRQAIIPDHLLGRVNSVYRFFGWGMMPIGTALGGICVVVVGSFASREVSLRAPWLIAAGLSLLVAIYAVPRLTSERLDSAREVGIAEKDADTEANTD